MLLVVAASVMVVGFVAAQGSGGAFCDRFGGSPSAPVAFKQTASISSWDVQVHSRDISTWYELESIQAQHGADCSGPPSSHENHTYEASVFQCRDHVMTAINAGGYGAIYLTPNQMLDFSAGGSVSFDVSTARMSTRDWWDVWITPYEDNLALPFDSGEVDLQGTPRRFVHIDTGNAEGAPVVTVNGTTYNTGWNTAPVNQGVTSTNPAADRQPFRITLSRTNIKVERLASATGSAEVFIEASFPALNWTTGVVQIGQHSYNPTKDGSGVPATWHWDNIGVSPTLPFTIIKGDRRFVDSVNQPVTFASPAPTNAMLRFSAVGIVDVSFDGGATYQRAVRQWASANGIHPEHMSSYWTPIPTGTSSVKFRFSADGWYPGPFIAKDFALWSSSGSASTATPTATNSAATATPSGSASTATPTSSDSTRTATAPGSTPTPRSISPTATPTVPAPTATPTRAFQVVTPSPTSTTSSSATLTGVVQMAGRSNHGGIKISIFPGTANAVTDSAGVFTIGGLLPGQTYRVVATSPGFLSAERASFRPTRGTNSLPTAILVAGDANGDGAITMVDVRAVQADFGSPPRSGATDFNGSGTVDISDLSAVASSFGRSGPTVW